ncbi:hypothetical protein [Olivibacter jilunii]|uniref:hypothetical protein n=1 Tax=Olivibacter jilunii TaxID=985016 RepID=UPI003F143013
MRNLTYVVYILLFTILSTIVLYFGRSFLVPIALAAIMATLFIEVSNWLNNVAEAYHSIIGRSRPDRAIRSDHILEF